MQTIRFLCLLLLFGSIAHRVFQGPGSEPSNATPKSVEQSDISSSLSKEGSQSPRSTVQTSTGQVHQNQSPNPSASANASLGDHLALQMTSSRFIAYTDVVSSVVEDLQLLDQACLGYRKSQGEFPPSLAALRTMKTIVPQRHGYRFTYARRRTADSFALNPYPVARYLRGNPRICIDESQVIKLQPPQKAQPL